MFLLDKSGSIGNTNYVKMKAFVSNFTGNILIGEAAAKMGLVSFSSGATTEFTFDQYLSPSLVIDAVNDLMYTGGGTNIAYALSFVDTYSFSYSAVNHDRVNATKVLILMTDGQSGDASTEAQTLRDKGVLIICIGIGSGVNDDQLLGIVGNETTLVTHVDTFEALTSVVGLIQGSACDEE